MFQSLTCVIRANFLNVAEAWFDDNDTKRVDCRACPKRPGGILKLKMSRSLVEKIVVL
jgi:hypothetical protein